MTAVSKLWKNLLSEFEEMSQSLKITLPILHNSRYNADANNYDKMVEKLH